MNLSSIHLALAEQLILTIKQEGKKALITYGELCDRVNNIVTPRNSANYIGDLSIICYENDMPLISVMVVNADTYLPGVGFFKLYHDLTSILVNDKDEIFRCELRKVREYEGWSKLAKILGLDIKFKSREKKQVEKFKSKVYKEGKLVLKQHFERERNSELIKDAKKLFLQNNGKLFCEVCGFDFEEFYGEIGKGIIEGHHSKPVSEMCGGNETKIEDIKMVCSNCHRVIHKNIDMKLENMKKCLNISSISK